MDDPVKIIFKYKNNNRRHQHHTYVFIGTVSSGTMALLNKIKDKSLYDSLIELSIVEYDKLKKKYGTEWYRKFFNSYHIQNSVEIVRTNKQQQKELLNKFGKDWYKIHIEEITLIEKKLFYSYESVVQSELVRIEQQKKRIKEQIADEEFVDYTTIKKIQRGGGDEDVVTGVVDTVHAQDNGSVDTDRDGVIEFEEGVNNNIELDLDEDVSFEEMEKVYQDMDVEVDKEVDKTTELIKKALKDEQIFKKAISDLKPFDISKDDNSYDEDIKNVFVKTYITSQYIFKDDTIKAVKDKITCSILNNSKFGNEAYIPPSRQYLWGEYMFNNKLDKIMIGQKWIRRTELLNIDIEPNKNIRVYEQLRENLKFLRDSIKRHGTKIRFEDDDFNILYDYEDYYMNNDIFMIDVYNELGTNYNPLPEELENVSNVFFRLYFPRIKQDDVKNIIEYLNTKSDSSGRNKLLEYSKSLDIYDSINNDLILENFIMKTVEDAKKDKSYKELFKQNYINQSTIHLNLRHTNKKIYERLEAANTQISTVSTGISKPTPIRTKIDLFRIFENFIVDKQYPFIQYQTADGQITFKYNEKDILAYTKEGNNSDILKKWFENAPYGISFKVRVVEKGIDKFMAINLNDNGRIDYKTQWKEEAKATIEDTTNTYKYIKDLIKKLNLEKNKFKFEVPEDHEFKHAFINTIQQFVLPNKLNINHNDLSEFARFFFPYVSLVIEPRKRRSKTGASDSTDSKFGTYLRYKRVSKYENQAKIEQRILYFMRNYEYNDKSLSDEIGKQFNITIDRSIEEIDRVRKKYPNIKRSRKLLKKLETVPKYKPPGINVEIQGKHRDNYKIRIAGARNKEQLDRISTFVNIMIFIYSETYLLKKKDRQELKEKLKELSKIARRRNKVNDIVDYEKDDDNVKQMTKTDKKRIGFKPETGQAQWTRACQNSGKDMKRRPQQYTSKSQLIKNGFKLNKNNNIYEKMMVTKQKGKKVEVTVRAVGLGDPTSNNVVFYSCNPKDNNEHMYIDFLSKSSNPYGECMPCCFKKDPVTSTNKQRRDYFMKCIGTEIKQEEDENVITKEVGDTLYILQDTNKLQTGRIGFLPRYLDFFFNKTQNRYQKIVQHDLVSTKEAGYFFKVGTPQDEHPFLNSVASVLDMNISTIKKKLIDRLEKDKSDMLFTALNNGDIKTQFGTREKYIDYIKTSTLLDFDIINHILSIPGIVTVNGLNIVVFVKKTVVINADLEKEQKRYDFVIMCQNPEEISNLKHPNRSTVFIIKESRNYFPIELVIKKSETDKDLTIKKLFKYDKTPDNTVNHVLDFYARNCKSSILEDITKGEKLPIAKKMYENLLKIGNKDYYPRQQNIDARNRCKYIITNNSTIVPVKPSGSIYNLAIIKRVDIKKLSLKETLDNIIKLYNLSDKVIPVKPIGLYYIKKTTDSANIIGIMTNAYSIIPVDEENVSISWVNKQGLLLENKHLYDKIDDELAKEDASFVVDDRISEVNYRMYHDETYELFRLKFSEYINEPDNEMLKKKFVRTIENNKMDKIDKREIYRKLVYRIVDKNLLKFYENRSTNNRKQQQDGGAYDKFIHIVNKLPDLSTYTINNNRSTCDIHKNKDNCMKNKHCYWVYDNCYLSLTKEMAISFINKLCEELVDSGLKASELIQKEGYFVSDIVDYNTFTQRPGQKVVKSTNMTVSKVLEDLFGTQNVPIIGKRRMITSQDVSVQEMNEQNALKNMGDYYVQNIIPNNLTLLRAFSNGYFWLKLQYYDLDSRNIGYYSILQTNLSNYFRSVVIDWLIDTKNIKNIKDDLLYYFNEDVKKDINIIIKEFILTITKDVTNSTNGVIEYYILNKTYKLPILIYNDNNKIIYIIDDGIIFDKDKQGSEEINNKKYDKYRNLQTNSIHIRYTIMEGSTVPTDVEVMYYK